VTEKEEGEREGGGEGGREDVLLASEHEGIEFVLLNLMRQK